MNVAMAWIRRRHSGEQVATPSWRKRIIWRCPGGWDAGTIEAAGLDALKLAESTKMNYRRSWRACCEWCVAKGVDPLDAKWDHILEFLLSGNIGGVRIARNVIGHVYHVRGMASPAADRRVGGLGTRQAAWQENVTEDRRKNMVRSQADYEGLPSPWLGSGAGQRGAGSDILGEPGGSGV